ncbi:type II secretion system major pseudopilin GspG [Pseudorhodoferax sp. LjRoot39]|uniref:type II secretion system major pseudopilin GspG n=1 Tax=Pseudorhodoferax sp. LjRoot39 TaxID=3342328 RepID=UPI003ECE07AA
MVTVGSRRPRGRRQCSAGFTLLELLVVMVIIGLLAAYVGPQYFGVVAKSEVKATKAQIEAFDKALATYRLDVGAFPSAQAGLGALVKAPPGVRNWAGPYLSKGVPNDPWGNPYRYALPGQHREYDLWSLGRDGRPGGQGDDADIGNW